MKQRGIKDPEKGLIRSAAWPFGTTKPEENIDTGTNPLPTIPGLLQALDPSPAWFQNVPVLQTQTGFDKKTAEGKEKLNLELLHRYNILLCRSKLLLHLQTDAKFMDDGVSQNISERLSRYSNALRDYREFRAEGGYLFPSNKKVEQIIQDNTLLEQKNAELAALQGGSEQANKLKREIDELRDRINNQFQQAVASITSGISMEKKTKAKKALWSRLIMALGGGLALVVPMLIMVLHPGKLTSMLTTSSFVVAAAICLAVFMEDSQSKDVIACTAAYAAVLVVFVGAGGGT